MFKLERSCPNKGKQLVLSRNGDCIECVSHDTNKDGYIRLYAGNGKLPRMQMLHRMVWEHVNGKIPDGYEVDHMCRNRKCCNVDHLQLLTHSEHKTKTNEERYSERIEGVIFALEEGFNVEDIARAFSVTKQYVHRYKRSLSKAKRVC